MASPASALASSVLPVPGSPSKSMPLGGRAPSLPNVFGSFRNSTTSMISLRMGPMPATSPNSTPVRPSLRAVLLDLANSCAAPGSSSRVLMSKMRLRRSAGMMMPSVRHTKKYRGPALFGSNWMLSCTGSGPYRDMNLSRIILASKMFVELIPCWIQPMASDSEGDVRKRVRGCRGAASVSCHDTSRSPSPGQLYMCLPGDT
mmetsp:Transcript_15788/g.42875  ORF Transcript_15788/g.42875 Transcript_15788/m.42875 type:complete len:202 (+) Transcript_15788:2099-2704(+)